jgi:RNA polymerase sigma-70 factor (ECF subfamily)
MSQKSAQPASPGASKVQAKDQLSLSSTAESGSESEWALIAALRQGQEAAFVQLLNTYHTSLVRLAGLYVPSQAIAEELAQETWLAVLQGIHRFEGRSSLKTWIFRILINQAKKRGQREGRQIPFSTLGQIEADRDEPAVDPDRFNPVDTPLWAGHWIEPPQPWDDMPESRLLSEETRAYLLQAIEALPANQREVITLRDIEGWSAQEVCTILEVSEANQRVLLHRARAKVRQALEHYFKL